MSKSINVGAVTAYGIAKKNGYSGTEAEWLESLHGAEYDDSMLRSAIAALQQKVTALESNGGGLKRGEISFGTHDFSYNTTQVLVDFGMFGLDVSKMKKVIIDIIDCENTAGAPIQYANTNATSWQYAYRTGIGGSEFANRPISPDASSYSIWLGTSEQKSNIKIELDFTNPAPQFTISYVCGDRSAEYKFFGTQINTHIPTSMWERILYVGMSIHATVNLSYYY